MRQCQQRHRFRNLWISQRHKNLDISITKHWFFFKYKNSLITYRGLLYSKYFHSGGNLNAKFGAPKIDYLSQKQCVTPCLSTILKYGAFFVFALTMLHNLTKKIPQLKVICHIIYLSKSFLKFWLFFFFYTYCIRSILNKL